MVPSDGSFHSIGAKAMAEQITRAFRKMQRQLKTRSYPDAVCCGIAGVDGTSAERALHRALLKQAWWRNIDPNRRSIYNDTTIGLRAGTDADQAIAIVSGTGSNGYGVDRTGNEAWVSGRGYLIADEGSGVQIGIDALHAARRAEDGRGPATRLEAAVYAHFKVDSTAELLNELHTGSSRKKQLAALNGVVEEVAERGDKVARKILDRAVDELLLMADTLHKRLNFGREEVDTVLIGGTINRNQYVLRGFLRGARKRKWMKPLALPDDPVSGALKMAAE